MDVLLLPGRSAGIHPVSLANLFAGLTRLLPDAQARQSQQLYRDPLQVPGQLMRTLLETFPDGRSIVLLVLAGGDLVFVQK